MSTKDQHVTNALNLHEQHRDHVTTQPKIRQKCISWIAGHCIVHNFKSEGINTSCGHLHHCQLPNEPPQHETMLCNDHPNECKK